MSDPSLQHPGADAVDRPLTIRPARAHDESRVARLLALRGITVEEALEEAGPMIESLPILMLACVPSTPSQEPEDSESTESPESPGGTEAVSAQPAPVPGPSVTPDQDHLMAPMGLSGAFLLAADESSAPQWMLTGLLVDPDAPRGAGLQLLSAVIAAIESLEPGAQVDAVVEAGAHATVAAYLAAGFREVSRTDSYAGAVFAEGGVLLRREALTPAQS